jgi:glycosyltransferase involved in cell wall biosynthesis
MRITIVLGPFLPVPAVRGGAVEKVHLLLAGAYRAAGHDVTIVSRQYGDFPPDETLDGIRHLRIPSFDATRSLAVNLLLTLRYAARVGRHLPAADVTVTNVFALPLFLPRRRAGRIYVQVGRFPKHQMFLYSGADRLQAVSTAVAEAIGRQAPWLRRKVRVIGYAIADAYFDARGARGAEKTILFVGRLAREKGVDILLKSFAELARTENALDGWKLRIVGPHEASQGGGGQSNLDELRALARPLGSRCEFVGPVFDPDALIREYRGGAIFVYPSLAAKGEALPVAPLEAMAAGCATVVSNLRCFDDYIEHGVTGLKFDHAGREPERALAAQLVRLVREPALLERIADAGHRAAGKFRPDAIARQMLDDFAELLHDPRIADGTAPQ